MQTTSSATSAKPSTASSRTAAAAWAAVAFVFVVLGFVGTSAGQTDEEVLYEYSFAIGATVIYGFLIGITFAIALWLGRPAPALGLKRFAWRWIWVALGLIILVLLLGLLLEPVLHAGEKQGFGPDEWRPDRAAPFVLNGVIAATLVPFTEELFFRGLGVRALLPFGAVFALVATSLAFGLGHGLFSALPILVPFGLALAWVRLRSDSVWPGTIAHGFYNGVAVLYLYFDLTA
jgi:membrane protease YdiL (CAAX protease family)